MPSSRKALTGRVVELVSRYLAEKTASWAPETLIHEKKALDDLLRFMSEDARELRRAEVLSYVADVKARRNQRTGEPWSARGVEAILAGVRRFLKWASVQGHVLEDLSSWIVLPWVLPLPRALSEEELVRLIERGPRPGRCQWRDRAILELLYGTGLRGGELLRLQLEDVDLKETTLLVRLGKGRKDRVVPFGERVREALARYLQQERRFGKEGTVFLSWWGRPLSRGGLRMLVSRAAKAAGIVSSVSTHRLRHSYATHLLRHGASLPALQKLLGHQSLASTQIYLGLEVSDLKRMLEKSHPRGKDV